jgi:hypothetical protein
VHDRDRTVELDERIEQGGNHGDETIHRAPLEALDAT